MAESIRVVAIDGPAGAGKSTVSKGVARALGWQLLDTGAIYRVVAVVAREAGLDWADEAALGPLAAGLDVRFRFEGELNHVYVGERDVTGFIRTPEISGGASAVSKLPAVRAGLLDLQRRLGRVGDVVVEGRDIGTVVFPDAGAKFFLTARPEVRARRRYDELIRAGKQVDLAQTLAEQEARDEQDTKRAAAPLRQADDAELVDSSELHQADVIAHIAQRVRARFRLTSGT